MPKIKAHLDPDVTAMVISVIEDQVSALGLSLDLGNFEIIFGWDVDVGPHSSGLYITPSGGKFTKLKATGGLLSGQAVYTGAVHAVVGLDCKTAKWIVDTEPGSAVAQKILISELTQALPQPAPASMAQGMTTPPQTGSIDALEVAQSMAQKVAIIDADAEAKQFDAAKMAKIAKAMNEDGYATTAPDGMAGMMKVSWLKQHNTAQVWAKQDDGDKDKEVPMNADYGPFPKNDMKGAPTCPLRKAKKLYQPVGGSSSGSRYFVIAACEGLKIAARWKNASLSLRVEGPWVEGQVSEVVLGLKAAGFDQKSDKHWSVHVDADTETLLRKTIGAMLFAVGVPWETMYPDLGLVKEMS